MTILEQIKSQPMLHSLMIVFWAVACAALFMDCGLASAIFIIISLLFSVIIDYRYKL